MTGPRGRDRSARRAPAPLPTSVDDPITRHAETDRVQLTEYEAEQVREIAAWKSTPPNPLSELWSIVVEPGAKALEKVMPDRLVEMAVERLDDVAALLAGQEDIKRRAGVRDLAELRERPLEDCDRMAKQVGLAAQVLATAEGAVTGAGGVWTTLVDVPLLFGLALRTIRKIGHCYGYPLEDRQGRALVLAILLTALSGSLEVRRERLQRLRELKEMVVDEVEVDTIVQELLSFLFQLEVFEQVPGVDVISGAVINLAEMVRVDLTSRSIFQERWLIDTGKLPGEIEPAEAPAWVLATGLYGALGRLAYSGGYYAGFAAALPFWTVAVVVRPAGNALTRGVGRTLERARDAAASRITDRPASAALPA